MLETIMSAFVSIAAILFVLAEIAILLLVLSVLWKLNQALGIYIREHEPEAGAIENDSGEEIKK